MIQIKYFIMSECISTLTDLEVMEYIPCIYIITVAIVDIS